MAYTQRINVTPAAGSITTAMLQDNAVTSAKLAAGSVSDVVSTTKKTGLGVSADGSEAFDAKGRITSVTEAAA